MKYKIWDKKTNIKDQEPKYFIDGLGIKESDGVFLVLDNSDNIQAIEIDRIIKGVYNLDANLNTEEVAKKYIELKTNIVVEQPIPNNEIEQLRKELEATQRALNEILLNKEV